MLSSMRMSIALLICLALSACETCERHPVVCTTAMFVGSALVLGAAESHSHGHAMQDRSQVPPAPDCNSHPELCK